MYMHTYIYIYIYIYIYNHTPALHRGVKESTKESTKERALLKEPHLESPFAFFIM